MAFYIDNQSLDDLNVFGRSGRESLFGLFGAVRTRGGSVALEQMFRYPLSDAASINSRSATIRQMLEGDVRFPLGGETIDGVEHYLGNTDPRTKLSPGDNTLQRRLKGAVGADTDFERLQRGVLATIELLATLREFVDSVTTEGPCREEFDALDAMLRDDELAHVMAEKVTVKLSYSATAALDELLRFGVNRKLQAILARVYHIDVCIAVAGVARERGFGFAHATDGADNTLTVTDMRHPMVPGAMPNSLRVDPDGNVIFLTGANMAGKSTFMKTLGLTVFLAHVGFPVPAAAMEFAVLDGIFTTINLPDNISSGYSHFFAEVMRVKHVAEALGRSRRLLVIFDELFRGTNVKDAYDATVEITRAFAGRRDCIFVISTHIIEAGEPLRRECPNVRFIYLPTVMEGTTPRYTYTLREGITADRHGMMIIDNEKIVDTIRRGGRRDGQLPPEEFLTDRQTLDDLNISGEFRPDSIFGIYNRTLTRGGKQLLERMFRSPMVDAAAINERAATFGWFAGQGVAFPASREEFDAVETWLLSGGAGSRAAALTTVAKRKLMQYVSHDGQYAATEQGLHAAAALLVKLDAFRKKLDRHDAPPTVSALLNAFDKLLTDRRLEWIFTDSGAKIPWPRLAARDHMLRTQLLPQVEATMRAAYAVDVYTSVARLASERGFGYAAASDFSPSENHISIDGFFHPAIAGAVPNSIRITRDQNVVFLTGANMAGKSTLMKSFSIAVYLAHMGFPVPARAMNFTVREGLYTSINVSDNLALGYSHFYAEVVRVKHVAGQVAAGRNLVVVFDELFKGTNVKDAFDGTVAVADAFGAHRNCAYVISTHIVEAGHTLAERHDNLRFVYMPTVMQADVPAYTYKMTPGISNDNHGLLIIRNNKILEILGRG